MPESADVFDALTAREYLSLIGQLYGLSAADAEQKAFALANLAEFAGAFDRRISSYSKGMRQLILIIASLLQSRHSFLGRAVKRPGCQHRACH